MGKRKHIDVSYWQCDWTGMPLGVSRYYIPVMEANGRVTRKGTYMNWQCARAHLNYMHSQDKITYEEFLKSVNLINNLAGYTVCNAPDYQALMHFGGKMTILEFTQQCNERLEPLSAVRMNCDGTVQHVYISPVNGNYDCGLSKEMECTDWDLLRPTRKLKNVKDKQMAVICNRVPVDPQRATYNTKASQLFKIELYGDVLIVCLTKRVDVDHMDEFLCFTMDDFEEQFKKKAKKPKKTTEDEAAAMSKEDFNLVEHEINKAFKELEAHESAGAKKISSKCNARTMNKSQNQVPAIQVA